MKLNPKFIQRDCFEGDKVDYRQAQAILKHRPDIVIFELPQSKNGEPGTIFNRYSCSDKPLEKVKEIIRGKRNAAKKYPYAKSDIFVWQNIEKMWRSGVNTQIYNVDAPAHMRDQFYLFPNYPSVRQDWMFWAYLYLRDLYMARNIGKVLERYSVKNNPVITIFLQRIHWMHVKFLLSSPSQQEIWEYYFGRFPEIKPGTIEEKIRLRSKVLAEYWKINQQFSQGI